VRWLQPQERLDESEVKRGLRLMLLDGVSTQVMGSLTGGALLVAFALLLGASHTVIGFIAAVGPLAQLVQIPSILMVERIRRRKVLVVTGLLFARSFWLLVAMIPWLVDAQHRIAVLLGSLMIYFSLAAFSSAAFNSWKRDLVPDQIMGRYFAKRLTIATAVGLVVTLAAGIGVEYGAKLLGDALPVYSLLFLAGGLCGLLGIGFLGRIPEPRMAEPLQQSLRAVLLEPFHDLNFRKLLIYLASWNFAINLAAPFFTVYMLIRLQYPIHWVLALSVLSQVANVMFFQIWGSLADRIGNKPVLGLAGSLFITSIALWPFTTMPDRYLLTLPLILVIHILAGISTAGVNLCAGSITLKLAPRGKATAFLATNALTSGIAATVAPALAGIFADLVSSEKLTVQLRWSSAESSRIMLTALDISGLDFLFLVSFLFGLYAMHRLLAVQEEGEVVEDIASSELYNEVRKTVRHVSNVAGLRRLTHFPYALLRKLKRDQTE
jgi:MFS family permease